MFFIHAIGIETKNILHISQEFFCSQASILIITYFLYRNLSLTIIFIISAIFVIFAIQLVAGAYVHDTKTELVTYTV